MSDDYVEVDFGAGLRRLPRWQQVLDLTPHRDGLVPAEGPVDWSQLDLLPGCLTVDWAGPQRGVVEAIARHPTIRFLYWRDAVGDVDLRSTNLGTVQFEGPGLGNVRLPESVETLLLLDPPAAPQVEAPDEGHGLDLRYFQSGSEVLVPDGLRRTRTLWLRVGGTVSAAALSHLTDLEQLIITFDDPPGTLTELSELRWHDRLRTLRLDDAFGLDSEGLPDLPGLRRLELSGTRRTTAAVVKGRYKGSGVTVSVSGAKGESWLAEHMDNPFRDWIEDSKGFGRAAAGAYARARRAVEAIVPETPGALAAAEQGLRGLVADLSSINDKYELIDTLYREQAWDAFRALAARLQVPEQQAEEWFDSGRRF
ncbi:hypothetical protein ACQP2P_30110 [Dactylosporangium sp. CA-139114]|uniref:hypothetical protein n=1 Tax=Dactylosporangium sp. CA-139114 TaxID=3239931 RepID=UPI003D96842B